MCRKDISRKVLESILPKKKKKLPRKKKRKAKEKLLKHPRNIQETSKKRPRNIQEKILQAIKNNPSITRKELEIQFGYSHGSIKYHIQVMSNDGIIKH